MLMIIGEKETFHLRHLVFASIVCHERVYIFAWSIFMKKIILAEVISEDRNLFWGTGSS